MSVEREVLVVEDEAVIRGTLRRLLERHSYRVSEATSVKESLDRFNVNKFDVIISDLKLPGAPGTDLIKISSAPVLIMTAYSSIRSAIDSVKLGAVDYIAKPFDHGELLNSLDKIVAEHGCRIAADSADDAPFPGMVGRCPEMRELFRRMRRVAGAGSPVLIQGESGTGKELVARAIHELSGRGRPMVAVNCMAIPENLIEAELFGHEKGAFAGAGETRAGLVEAADGGTLFLDEIGELPRAVQGRLVRVLQDGEVRRVGAVKARTADMRLIAATQRDLEQLVAEGRFREDLYYRINVMSLHLPPLRERGEDIGELARRILSDTCERLKSPSLRFSDGAERAIAAHQWPGNVRELANAIEKAVVLCEGESIGEELLSVETPPWRESGNGARNGAGNGEAAAEASPALSLEDYFRHFVREHQDSMTETELARQLGISRKCLWERRQRYDIPRKKRQTGAG